MLRQNVPSTQGTGEITVLVEVHFWCWCVEADVVAFPVSFTSWGDIRGHPGGCLLVDRLVQHGLPADKPALLQKSPTE